MNFNKLKKEEREPQKQRKKFLDMQVEGHFPWNISPKKKKKKKLSVFGGKRIKFSGLTGP